MRKIKRVVVDCGGTKHTATVGGTIAMLGVVASIRIRWAGGAGGTFRLYRTLQNGQLVVSHIPQERIVDVVIEYAAEEKK